MVEVMQLPCPACQQVLRIPSEWTDQTMRCKHCQTIFQARRKGPSPVANLAVAAVPQPVPIARLASTPAKQPPAAAVPIARTPAANGNLFAFEEPGAVTVVPRLSSRTGGGGVFKAVVLGGVVFAGVGAAAVVILVVLGSQIKQLFNTAPADQQAQHSTRKNTSSGTSTSKDTAKQTSGDVGQKTGQTSDPKNDPKLNSKIDPKDTAKKELSDPYVGAIYPRRALLISVCDYAIAPPLPYGKPAVGGFLGSNPRALAARLEESLDFPHSQIAELSDKAAKPTLPRKAAIEETIVDFLNTSRGQDCILLVFSGHVVEMDKEAYLVPVEGRLNDPKSLVSFTWLYAQLGKCKAHQKVLVLDIGQRAPIGDVLNGMIQKPPANVRVWTSCIAGERALEWADGSLFLEALCHSAKNVLTRPDELIPLETMARKVDQYIQERAKPKNHKQTIALLGKDKPGSVLFNPKEAAAPAVAIKAPAVAAPNPEFAELKGILDEIARIPAATDAKLPPLNPNSLEFPAKALADYKADYNDLLQFKNDKEKFPLRAAVAEAVLALQKNVAMKMRDKLDNKKDKELAVLKNQILEEQKALSVEKLALKDALDAMLAADEQRGAETKRWQVLYDFVLLRLKSRFIYVMDYNFILGQFRGDTRDDLAEGERLWRLTPRDKLSTNEGIYKDMAKEVKKGWEKLPKSFPNTPWAILAERESAIMLGVIWRPSKN